MVSLLILIFVLSIPLAAPPVDCVCIKPPSESAVIAHRKQLFEKAAVVFEGKVIALDAYKVTFRLSKRWKGESVDEVVLATGAVPGYDGTPLPQECGYEFTLGEEYLVYGYGDRKRITAFTCTTFLLKDSAEEEKALDQIKLHQTIKDK